MKSASKMATNSPRADLQAGLERTRLVPGPIGAVDVVDVDAFGREAADRRLGNGSRVSSVESSSTWISSSSRG